MKTKKKTNPFSWDKITGDKYYKITDILSSADSDFEKTVSLLSVILDRSEDELWNLPIPEVSELSSKLEFLNKFDLISGYKPKYINTPKYKLKVLTDVSKMTYAQYVDFQQFVQLPFRDGYDKILSIFIIPDGYKYNTDYDIADVQKEIRENIPWVEVQTLFNFFLMRSVELLRRSLTYYEAIVKKTKNPTLMQKYKTNRDQIIESLNLLFTLGSVS